MMRMTILVLLIGPLLTSVEIDYRELLLSPLICMIWALQSALKEKWPGLLSRPFF